MSIFFSAAHNPGGSAIARALSAGVPLNAANDNSSAVLAGDALVQAALRHFAVHGLGAARHARIEAEAAHARGDASACQDWLAVCGLLDRRMGREAERVIGLVKQG